MIYDQAEDTLLNKKYKAILCDYTLIINCITHTIISKQWECIIKINVGNLKNILHQLLKFERLYHHSLSQYTIDAIRFAQISFHNWKL